MGNSNDANGEQCSTTEGMLELDNLKFNAARNVNGHHQAGDDTYANYNDNGDYIDDGGDSSSDDEQISSSFHHAPLHQNSDSSVDQLQTYFLGHVFNPNTGELNRCDCYWYTIGTIGLQSEK